MSITLKHITIYRIATFSLVIALVVAISALAASLATVHYYETEAMDSQELAAKCLNDISLELFELKDLFRRLTAPTTMEER